MVQFYRLHALQLLQIPASFDDKTLAKRRQEFSLPPMLHYPTWLKPDLLHIGPLRVRWYGIMYLIGFLVGRQLARYLSRIRYLRLKQELVDDYLIFLFVGMLLGARLIYMLVYYEATPEAPFQWWTPFAVWEGGLAFHGAALGMFLASALFAKIQKVPFWNLTDSLALAGSQGIIWGRIGNFINSELVGRPTDGPMGMQFPVRDFEGSILGYTEPRHPSQLYEAVTEGIIPFIIIWIIRPKIRNQGVLGGIWLCLYAVGRFVVEFFREKDQQMPYYLGFLTIGQILCGIMFLLGAIVIAWNQKKARPVYEPEPADEEVAA